MEPVIFEKEIDGKKFKYTSETSWIVAGKLAKTITYYDIKGKTKLLLMYPYNNASLAVVTLKDKLFVEVVKETQTSIFSEVLAKSVFKYFENNPEEISVVVDMYNNKVLFGRTKNKPNMLVFEEIIVTPPIGQDVLCIQYTGVNTWELGKIRVDWHYTPTLVGFRNFSNKLTAVPGDLPDTGIVALFQAFVKSAGISKDRARYDSIGELYEFFYPFGTKENLMKGMKIFTPKHVVETNKKVTVLPLSIILEGISLDEEFVYIDFDIKPDLNGKTLEFGTYDRNKNLWLAVKEFIENDELDAIEESLTRQFGLNVTVIPGTK